MIEYEVDVDKTERSIMSLKAIMATKAARERIEREGIEPLTEKELRLLVGDKIYIEFLDELRQTHSDTIVPYYGGFESFISTNRGRIVAVKLPLDYYGKEWLAYRL